MKRYAARYLYTLTSPEPLQNAFVEVEDDGTIVRTGVCDPSEEVLEGAIVPGFVNAHCHLELYYMKVLFRKGPGMAGFIDQINELRDTQSREERVKALQEAMDGLWAQGVQAVADISNGSDSFALKQIHPLYTRTFLEVFGANPAECGEVIDGVLRLQEEARSLGLDAAPTPHACYTMSPQLITASAVEGLRSGFLSYHSEESDEEEQMMRSGSGPMWDNRVKNGIPTPPVTGTSSLEYFLERLKAGVPVPVEGHVLLVHECCLTPEGARAARATLKAPFLAICPLSNIFIHNTLPPIPVMRESGIPICVGTDSLSSNDQLDMVAELRWSPARSPASCSLKTWRTAALAPPQNPSAYDARRHRFRPHLQPPAGRVPGHQPPAPGGKTVQFRLHLLRVRLEQGRPRGPSSPHG